MKMSALRLLTLCGLLLLTLFAFAEVPGMINYQGKLTKADGTLLADGTYPMTFAIYNQPDGGLPLWSEVNNGIQVKKGLFSTLLGSVNNLPANIFDGTGRFFGVTVGVDPEMKPRQQISSVPFALKAGVADTVVNGSITKVKLAPDATSDINDILKTGWIPAGETWTLLSFNTINKQGQIEHSGIADKYSIGDKLKFTANGTVIYAYLVAAPAFNRFNFIVDSSISNISGAITLNYSSHILSPVGFPQWFNYVPTWNGLSINPSSITRFNITGRTVNLNSNTSSAGYSNANNYNMSLPVKSANITGYAWWAPLARTMDNSILSTTSDHASIPCDSLMVYFNKAGNSNGWTASNGKYVDFSISYEIE